MSILLADLFDYRGDVAILRNQRFHDVVDRLQVAGLGGRRPSGKRHNIVTRLPLRLREDGEQERGDEIDLEVDLLFLRPLVAKSRQSRVRPRQHVLPEANAK